MRTLFLLFLFLVQTKPASAESCGWQKQGRFFTCDSFSEIEASAQAEPSIQDMITVNPAGIPTFSLPVVAEATYSNRSDSGYTNQLQLSALKGFSGFGFGFTSFDAGSFSGPDLYDEFAHSTYANAYNKYREGVGVINGLRAGSAVQLPLGFVSKLIHLKAGASLSTSGQSSVATPTIGALADIKWIVAGFSTGNEMLTKSLPRLDTQTWTVGLLFGDLNLGATGSRVKSSEGVQNIHLYSMRWTGSSAAAFVGYRLLRDDREAHRRWLGNLDLRVTKNLVLGYIYGLYRDSHSLKLSLLFGGSSSSAGGPTPDPAP